MALELKCLHFKMEQQHSVFCLMCFLTTFATLMLQQVTLTLRIFQRLGVLSEMLGNLSVIRRFLRKVVKCQNCWLLRIAKVHPRLRHQSFPLPPLLPSRAGRTPPVEDSTVLLALPSCNRCEHPPGMAKWMLRQCSMKSDLQSGLQTMWWECPLQ